MKCIKGLWVEIKKYPIGQFNALGKIVKELSLNAGVDGDIDLPNGFEYAWILIIGICGLCAHFCITKALALAPAVVVSPLEFLRLPFISIIGYFIYNEDLEAVVFLGAILVLLANLINIRNESKNVTKS